MGQKVNCNPQKLTSIVSYLQRSRTVHNIKDLEKHLPSVASINGMQVKDYLQTLQDDNKIRVEKIGSGNWYWSFASEDKRTRQKALDDAKAAHDKTTSIVEELKKKVAEAKAQRDDEAEMLVSGVESREELEGKKDAVEKEIKRLERGLSAYSDCDPTELERKREEIAKCKVQVEGYTDDIFTMESWVSGQYGKEVVETVKKDLYGDELDDEEGMLREMV